MKKIMFFAVILIWSCNASQKNDPTGDSSNANGSFQLLAKTANDPFVHWELMSQRAEDKIGTQPYVLVLPLTYQTDGTASTCVLNLQHSADVANGSPDTNRVAYPYTTYANLDHRFNTWVYVSARLMPKDTVAIKAWMLQTASAYHSAGLILDQTENVATLYKIKWHSIALKP